jgi:hypothetical protein
LKDNYLVPSMEQILQSVSIFSLLSLLDGFSGYNQVLVAKEDLLKMTFGTKWGTYAYDKMPFRLINWVHYPLIVAHYICILILLMSAYVL